MGVRERHVSTSDADPPHECFAASGGRLQAVTESPNRLTAQRSFNLGEQTAPERGGGGGGGRRREVGGGEDLNGVHVEPEVA
eukprot:3835421-Rhodomonas_salina.1